MIPTYVRCVKISNNEIWDLDCAGVSIDEWLKDLEFGSYFEGAPRGITRPYRQFFFLHDKDAFEFVMKFGGIVVWKIEIQHGKLKYNTES